MRHRTRGLAAAVMTTLLLGGCAAAPGATGATSRVTSAAGPRPEGVTGRVTNADGSPAVHLPILITGPKGFVGPTDATYIAVSTDGRGRFASDPDFPLPDGTYTIHAGRNEPWTEDIFSKVTVTPENIVETTRRVPVSGDRAPASDLVLDASGSILVSSPDATRVLIEDTGGRLVRKAVAGSNGVFRATGLRAGSYTVVASRTDGATPTGWASAPVTVRAGRLTTGPTLRPTNPLLSVHGRVVGAPASEPRPLSVGGGPVGSDFGYDIGGEGSATLAFSTNAETGTDDTWSSRRTLVPGLYSVSLNGALGPETTFRLTEASAAEPHDVRFGR